MHVNMYVNEIEKNIKRIKISDAGSFLLFVIF